MSDRLALPDGRTVALDASTRLRVRSGVVVAADVVVRDEPAVWDEMVALAENLRGRYAGRLPSEIDGLHEARTLYNDFGMEPTRYRPSSEALLRRVLQDRDLYRISNVVDCCNLASLSFLLPIGLYDLDRVDGDVTLRAGHAGEGYPGIRKGTISLEGRLGLFDAQGGFGSPTSDSARTSVSESTRRLLGVVMATGSYDGEATLRHAGFLGELFVRHCGGRILFTGTLGG